MALARLDLLDETAAAVRREINPSRIAVTSGYAPDSLAINIAKFGAGAVTQDAQACVGTTEHPPQLSSIEPTSQGRRPA